MIVKCLNRFMGLNTCSPSGNDVWEGCENFRGWSLTGASGSLGGGGPEALESSPICCSHSAFGCGCNSKSQPPVLTAVQYLLPQWLPRGDGLDLYKTLIQKKPHIFLCQVFRNSNQKPLRQVTERQE